MKNILKQLYQNGCFKNLLKEKIKKIYNSESLKRLARDNIKLDDKHLNYELDKKMLNPYSFTDRNLRVEFKINLDTHHNNHANSNLTNISNFPEFGIEVRCIKKIMKGLSVICARLKNQ